ncbi:MAG: hypothetical protein JKY09_08430 [Crocinitomicaceae bacterium]|nr:hypothetical protein [Crocinitomicaceae bacterium]
MINEIIAKTFDNATEENVVELIDNAIETYIRRAQLLTQSSPQYETPNEISDFEALKLQYEDREYLNIDELIDDVYMNLRVIRPANNKYRY